MFVQTIALKKVVITFLCAQDREHFLEDREPCLRIDLIKLPVRVPAKSREAFCLEFSDGS
jgi:hypothetical protein